MMYAIRHIPTGEWLVDNPEGAIPVFTSDFYWEIVLVSCDPPSDYEAVEVEIVEVKK